MSKQPSEHIQVSKTDLSWVAIIVAKARVDLEDAKYVVAYKGLERVTELLEKIWMENNPVYKDVDEEK